MVKEKTMKQTEIGLLPEDWEVFKIEDLTPKNVKYTIVDGPFGSNLKTIHYRRKGIPIITSGYVTDGKFYAEKYLYVDKEKFQQEKRSSVQGGDIVMAKIGERCGASAILPLNHTESILSGNALKIKINEEKFNTKLIAQILYNDYLRGNLNQLRTVGAQPAISMANLKIYKIPLPPLPEQEAIAEALSDADAWIESLEQLIAKKRLIKQGAMQELLTPEEDWEVKKLGDCLDYLQPTPFLVKSTDYNPNNDIPVLTAGKTFILGYTNETEGVFSSLPTIIFDDFTTATKFVDFPFKAKSSAMKMLILKNNQNDIRFLYQLMANLKFQVGDHKRHWIGEFANLEIKMPSLTEQTRIATILSDIDAELEALEGQLGKARKVKQGMMQELLTGRVRLV